MGAVAVSSRLDGVQGNHRVVEAVVEFSASYATGGDSVSPAALGLKEVRQISQPSHRLSGVAVATDNADEGVSIQLAGTPTAPLLKLFTSDGTEATNATDNSGIDVVVRFLGS